LLVLTRRQFLPVRFIQGDGAGNRDIQRHGQYRRQNYGEVQKADRQSHVEQRKNDSEVHVAKNGVEYTNTDVAGKLAAGEETDDALKPPPGNERVLRNRYNRRMLRVHSVAG